MFKKVKKGATCKLSEIGHNNFYYPSNHLCLIKDDCLVETLTWINFNELIPVKISASLLDNADLYGYSDNDMLAVWLSSDSIEDNND